MQSTETVTKPSKQRRILYQAADHMRHRFFAAHFSPELRASHLVKSFPVRSGDTVRIMRGDHKGLEGKVTRVDKRKYEIYIEGLTREKVDGTTIFVPIHPSKVMITNLNLDDKWRKKILEKKKLLKAKPKEKPRPKLEKKAEVIRTKPPAAQEEGEEKKVSTEQEPHPEEKPLFEETPREQKRPKKKSVKIEKKTFRKATTQEPKVKSKESAKEAKPRAKPKKPKRRAIKKAEGGE